MGRAALLIVDVQNDFLPPNGSLAVPEGRDIIPVIQSLLKSSWDWHTIVAAQVSTSLWQINELMLHRSSLIAGQPPARSYLLCIDTLRRAIRGEGGDRRKREAVLADHVAGSLRTRHERDRDRLAASEVSVGSCR